MRLGVGDLLRVHGLEPRRTAVMFHVSDKPALHAALPMLAAEEPELFDAFQNQHGERPEATLRKRDHLLAFVNVGARDYCLAGLFDVRGYQFQSNAEMDANPCRITLRQRYGDVSFVELGRETGRDGRLVFDLVENPALSDLKGRLIVAKPGGRTYARLAENLDCPIVELARNARLVPPAPDWDRFIATAAEVRRLPATHAARLREWRGIYLVLDEMDGQRYVGSAYGEENLLGRWQAHVAGMRGVTVELRERDPGSFRFSILELLSPDAKPEDVVAREALWKDRLATRTWGLNRN